MSLDLNQIFKGLVAWFHSFLLSYLCYIRVHSFHHIHTTHSTVAICRNPFPSHWKPSLGCRAENWTRACFTDSRRTTNWATPHPKWARPHCNELRRAENWTRTCFTESRRTTNGATPHPKWARPHSNELRRTLLSYEASKWASLHHPELQRPLMRCAAPYWAPPYPSELRHTLMS
jgi:hypothetical protein